MSSYDLLITPIYPIFKGISLPNNIFLASVPLSIISIFVKTPIVLFPSGSSYLAIYKPSETLISWFAGITQRIIVSGFSQYFLAIALVIASISLGWSEPYKGILVIPGKSTNVRFGQEDE